MKRFRNILFVAFMSFVALFTEVNASVNNEGKYIDDTPTYKMGDLVKLTIPGTKESKEFYVALDYKNDIQDCASETFEEDGVYYSYCDFIYLVEKENSIKNISGDQYDDEIDEMIDSADNFYNRLYDSRIVFDVWPMTPGDVEFICDADINLDEAVKINCPAWLGYGFWLDEEEDHYDEFGNVDGTMRWAVTMPSLDDDRVNVAAWVNDSERKNDIKFGVVAHKENVSKVVVNSGTTNNPKTGITNPLFIGGLGIIVAIGVVLFINKKNLFNRI